jgi:hypothetical protein
MFAPTDTVTATVPDPGGTTALIAPSLVTEKLVARVPPKSTGVAPVKPLPVMVTDVPPDDGPESGTKALTGGQVEDVSMSTGPWTGSWGGNVPV